MHAFVRQSSCNDNLSPGSLAVMVLEWVIGPLGVMVLEWVIGPLGVMVLDWVIGSLYRSDVVGDNMNDFISIDCVS